MECSVCYEQGSFQKLCCGHSFCTGCVKTWYLKGTGTGCPMCRRPIYFKGFHKLRDQWNEEAWENKCADAFSEAIDTAIEDAIETAQYFPKRHRREIVASVIDDVCDIEKTYRFLKSENLDAEDVDYVLNYTEDYYSDRRINKFIWLDDPPEEFKTRYPFLETAARVGKRSRAQEDSWVTLNLSMEFYL